MASAGSEAPRRSPAEAGVPEWRLQPPKRSTASDRDFHDPGLLGFGFLRGAQQKGSNAKYKDRHDPGIDEPGA